MREKSKFCLSLMIALSIVSCSIPAYSASAEDSVPKGEIQTTINEDKSLVDLQYETVTDATLVPDEIKNKIDQVKASKGYYIFNGNEFGIKDGSTYILACFGEKPTSGYSVQITGLKNNKAITTATIKEIAPAKGSIIIQITTFPYTLIKVNSPLGSLNVVNETGEKYNNLNGTSEDNQYTDYMERTEKGTVIIKLGDYILEFKIYKELEYLLSMLAVKPNTRVYFRMYDSK